MKFQIPFTISGLEKQKRKAKPFRPLIKQRKGTKLEKYLKDAELDITREEYLSIVVKSGIITFVALYVIFSTLLLIIRVKNSLLLAFLPAVVFALFISFSQFIYPKIFISRKQKSIEKNLIPALEDMLIQLDSGIPLFTILSNIALADYSELSEEFKKAVKKINAGFPEVEVLEEIGEKNPSVYFRRTLWQISNGMKAGSDIGVVIKESMKSLNEEQVLQIQNYGNKLNPLIMFYMLISIILPALAITFLTIISSLIGLSQTVTTASFIGLFVLVMLVQIMFLGAIRSARPSLL